MQFIAKLIIERSTGVKVDKISVSPEKSLTGIDIHNRGIRMDLYVESFENERLVRVYDIEPNNYNLKELPMRTRYNQSLTDAKLLDTGEHFSGLAEYISIWILPFDPFGQNRMLYTVKNSVENFPNIIYNDGVKKLFLYTGGTLGGNEDLKKLLTYFSDSKSENATDSDLKQLHDIVENIKHNQEVGVRYMTLQDYIEMERDVYFRDIEDQLKEDMRQRLEPEIKNELRLQLENQIRNELTLQLETEIRDELSSKLEPEIRNNLKAQLISEIKKELKN